MYRRRGAGAAEPSAHKPRRRLLCAERYDPKSQKAERDVADLQRAVAHRPETRKIAIRGRPFEEFEPHDQCRREVDDKSRAQREYPSVEWVEPPDEQGGRRRDDGHELVEF